MESDFDNKLAGICMALLCGMDREATARVLGALGTFAADRQTPVSEAQFYRDLAASIELPPPPVWGVFEQLATLH